MALATSTNTSFLDRLYKNRQQCTLTCSGLQLAKQLDLREDIVTVIVMEVVDSVSSVLPHMSHRRDGERTTEFLGQLIDWVTCSNRM